MKASPVALGLDYGTESVRAIFVETQTGRTLGEAVVPYRHGVITDALPGTNVKLGHDWALQDSNDYVKDMTRAVKTAMKAGRIAGERVCGIGISFTACTMLPAKADGTPLAWQKDFARHPNAWCKLWKHHAAQPQADKMNVVANRRSEKWLARYGGIISSEWFFPKALQAIEEDPRVWKAADVYIEAGEWLAWQLTGRLARSTCHGGYKQCWHKREGYPSAAYLRAVHPELPKLVTEKLAAGPRLAPGEPVGGLTAAWAKRLGLPAGIAVSSSIIDAHSGVPGAGVASDGVMAIVMGTSSCHMLMDKKEKLAKGISGVVGDGILPGFYGYEAGQVAVGDIFAWYVNQCAPASVAAEAKRRGKSVHELLTEQAAKLRPGENRLLALDWWNGNRTPFVDANLSGLMVGLNLGTTPAQIYRALLEATAFGTLRVIEAFEAARVQTKSIVACGGIAQKNPLIVQIYADVTGRPIDVASSPNASSLGAAILGAVAAGKAAGGYDSAAQAARKMVAKPKARYRPNAAAHKVYKAMYADYRRLSEHFGRYKDPVMRNLRSLA
ncbi:MAG: ribulokinase [Phycisphaerae bacterium]|nr:ribulokinase [Phycisphaerae bacterium]